MNNFYPLDVMDQVNISNLISRIDKCNGYSLVQNPKEKDGDIRSEVYSAETLGMDKRMTKFE
jgi:hypothetical protein